jgi:hypothetical protein
MIELALSMLTTVFVVFWVFEMVMVVYTYAVISDCAKEGVRYAIVHGADNSNPSGPGTIGTTNVTSLVTSYAKLSLHDVSAITVTPSYPDNDNQIGMRVQVDVAYTYVPYIKLPFPNPTIHATAQGRITY